MEKFLKDYVKMLAESNDIKLNRKKLQGIVNDLMDTEEIWDTLDSYIYDYLKV